MMATLASSEEVEGFKLPSHHLSQLLSSLAELELPTLRLSPKKKRDFQRRLQEIVFRAVLNGHKSALKRAGRELRLLGLASGNSFDFYDDQHYTPLMYACEENKMEVAELLLKERASVAYISREKKSHGLNAVHVASNKGHQEVLDMLISHDVLFYNLFKLPNIEKAVNQRGAKHGWTPLMYAVKNGHLGIVKRLLVTGYIDLKATSKKKQNVLHIAARETRLDCLKELHAKLPQTLPEAESLYIAIDKNGWNILHHACAGGRVEVVTWLVETVPDLKKTEVLNLKNKTKQYTPLLVACEYKKVEVVRYLLETPELEVDPSACATDGEGSPESSPTGMTGLHIAAIHDCREIAQLLIEHGCPLDIQDNTEQGDTALHIAHRKSSLDVVDILRSAGGDTLIGIRNKDGKTAGEIEPEDVIPPLILKLGKEFVDVYRKALRSGKKKIPRCGLLVLGYERVGKTSLIRLLTGEVFIANLDSTRGIDNTVLDAVVDVRSLNVDCWKEVNQEDQARENDSLFVSGVVDELGSELPPQQEKEKKAKWEQQVSEEELLHRIDAIVEELAQPEEVDMAPLRNPILHPSKVSQPPHTPNVVTHVSPPPLFPIFQPTQPPSSSSTPKPKPTPPPTLKPRERPQQPRGTESKPPPSPPPEQPKPKETEPLQTRGQQRSFNVSRSQAVSISRALKTGSQKNKEPTLHFCTLDFAGQKEYYPMHHCFITRRAMYLVVFNLQEVVSIKNQEDQDNEPLEKIRYWLNSIHAHIHPGDDDVKRVCLVGTHRSPKDPEQGRAITEDELDKVDERLRKEFYENDEYHRYVNHLCFPGRRIFAAVENSYDQEDEREVSGALALQRELRETSKQLPFLNEDYPILWLRFENELIWLRQDRQRRALSPVVKLASVVQLAEKCSIDEEQRNASLLFFHYTGTIVCLNHLPNLFLGELEKAELKDFVLLDPKWLIKVMKIVMELKRGLQGIPGKDQRELEISGIASAALLRKSWEECCTDELSFRQLCLILQAYCLIHPINSDDDRQRSSPSVSRSHSEPTPTLSPALEEPSRAQTSPTSKSFLIPSMLPENPPKEIKEKFQFSFYVDFCGFLPQETFHRLICLMLSKSNRKRELLSTSCCLFTVEGTRWKVEVLPGHILKVSVCPNRKEKPSRSPSAYLLYMHTEFLQKICDCEVWEMKGLVYRGGPQTKCECNTLAVMPYVRYSNQPDEQEIPADSEVECEECGAVYDVDKLLDPKFKVSECSSQEDVHVPPAVPTATVHPTAQGSMKVDANQVFVFTGPTEVHTPHPHTGLPPPVQDPQISTSVGALLLSQGAPLPQLPASSQSTVESSGTPGVGQYQPPPNPSPLDTSPGVSLTSCKPTSCALGYLQGVDVVNQTSLTYSGKAYSFHWEQHGFKIHFPENALPPGMSECRITITASILGQYQLPDNSKLVSGVYWIACPVRLTRPVTLEIQHCSSQTELDDNRLSFVTAKCTQKDLPYSFRVLDGGVFSPHTSYGSIELTHFSALAVILRTLLQLVYGDVDYFAKLYCIPKHSVSKCEAHVVIVKNTDLHITGRNSKYSAAEPGPGLPVQFDASERITLDIEETIVRGWSIFPLSSKLTITEQEVGRYRSGQEIPHCELCAEWKGEREPRSTVYYRIYLKGTKEQPTFLVLQLPLAPGLVDSVAVTSPPLPSDISSSQQQYRLKLHSSNAVQISDVLRKCEFLPSFWKTLAERLCKNMDAYQKIDTGAIQKSQSGDDVLCLQETIRQWLQKDRNATWEQLAEEVSMISRHGDATKYKILDMARNWTHDIRLSLYL